MEKDLGNIYKGELYYGKDAFEGLSVMEKISKQKVNKDSNKN